MSNIFFFDILNTPTSKIKKKTLIIFFILYVTLIVISSIVYGYLLNKNLNLYDENFNLIFENIPFSNGEIISNLKNFNEYFTEYLGLGVKFYLQKTPAIPLIIYSISLISENFFFILILKNLIFYSLYFFISYLTIRSINKKYLFFIIISIVPIIIPYNFTVSLNFVYEDCLTALILPSILFDAVSNNQILTYSPEYFGLRSPYDRRLYELCRKHCGNQAKFEIGLENLYDKFGVKSPIREFRRKIKEIETKQSIPDYYIMYCTKKMTETVEKVIVFKDKDGRMKAEKEAMK